ncbi:MAG: phosphohydrolase, partial [Proteobacteria bacterium]|nr:phosphohydrolase [Pseudomonadota bacterium]
IVSRKGFRRVAQFTERDTDYDMGEISKALDAAGVEHFTLESRGVLSRYTDEGETPSLFVHDSASGRLTEVSAYTPLYQRFAGAVLLSRIFVRPDQVDIAKPLVAKLTGAHADE